MRETSIVDLPVAVYQVNSSPNLRSSSSSSNPSPSVNQVSVTIPTAASIWEKQSIREFIFGQRERALVFMTVKGTLLLSNVPSFSTLSSENRQKSSHLYSLRPACPRGRPRWTQTVSSCQPRTRASSQGCLLKAIPSDPDLRSWPSSSSSPSPGRAVPSSRAGSSRDQC